MGDVNPSIQQACALISGGFADFLVYLTELPQPIVVGADYPQKKLLEAFKAWAAVIDFDTTNADISIWREACRQGFFRRG